jgi:hypothetical protein
MGIFAKQQCFCSQWSVKQLQRWSSYQLLQQPLVLMQAQQRQRVELVVSEPLGPLGRGRSRCKDSACMQQLLGREPGR